MYVSEYLNKKPGKSYVGLITLILPAPDPFLKVSLIMPAISAFSQYLFVAPDNCSIIFFVVHAELIINIFSLIETIVYFSSNFFTCFEIRFFRNNE